jgi:hypothetical protein
MTRCKPAVKTQVRRDQGASRPSKWHSRLLTLKQLSTLLSPSLAISEFYIHFAFAYLTLYPAGVRKVVL